MLTKEQNQTICSVGPGTSTGKLFRSIWLPALQSAQLSKHAGPPVRLKLLGEELEGQVYRADSFPPVAKGFDVE